MPMTISSSPSRLTSSRPASALCCVAVCRAASRMPRQFDLLVFLMRNGNRTVTPEEIAASVWKQVEATWTNVIEVYINQLRKKLESAEVPTILHTIRGTINVRSQINVGTEFTVTLPVLATPTTAGRLATSHFWAVQIGTGRRTGSPSCKCERSTSLFPFQRIGNSVVEFCCYCSH